MLKQRSKLEWIKLGDGNNKYFHASIKAKNKTKSMRYILTDNGTE